MTTDNQRPRRLSGVKEYSLADELVLYAPDREVALSFNQSAALIWSLCDGNRTALQISEEIAQRIGVSTEDVLPDVQDALARFVEVGVIEPEPSAS